MKSETERSVDARSRIKRKLTLASILLIMTAAGAFFHFRGRSAEEKPALQTPPATDTESLSKGIDSVFRLYGLKDEWTKTRKKKEKDQPGLFYREALIPADLPAMNLNVELSAFLKGRGLQVKTGEEPRTRNLKIEAALPDAKDTRYGLIELIYSDSIRRSADESCIVLDSIDHLGLADAGRILGSGEEFSVILPLGNDKADYQSLIIDSKTDFLIELTIGDEESYASDIRQGMTEKEWRGKLKSVCMNFPSAGGVILTGNRADSEFGRMIAGEFGKCGLRVVPDSKFTRVYSGKNRTRAVFERIRDIGPGVFIASLNADEAEELFDAIAQMKRSGRKFYDFTGLMKRIEKVQSKDEQRTN